MADNSDEEYIDYMQERERWLLEENERLRAENETLRRDVKTAVMGDSAELQDVKRENEKLREALAAERERCARIAEDAGATMDEYICVLCGEIAAAIRKSGDE